jgi:ribosomal protein S27AE
VHNSKICFKCKVTKPLTEFYKHPQMPDGRVNKCKDCNKEDVRKNRADKIDYYLEYDRSRANPPKRVNARIEYAKTENGKSSAKKSQAKWKESNQIKRSANLIVNNYVRDGKLVKSSFCENCGKDGCRIHGHHDDYAYPLSVRWLCAKCHTDWHNINGEGLNG